MKKICVVTGTRAEYGLLYWTLKELKEEPSINLQLCVTGMHLSPEFGNTYKQIEKDGFQIDKKVEVLLSSDSSVGVSKSIGLGVISFSEAFAELKPDLILILGDRFEIFAAATAAMISKIPIAHCHGGEATEGLIDEPIRHSITKMSHVHFTATEEYSRRVMQLGEQPANVHNVGALGIENINRLKLLDKQSFEESIDFKLGKKNVLVTFHPVTLENATAEHQFKDLLRALDELEETHIIFTKPNADTDGRVIIHLIDEYVKAHANKSIAFISLGQLRYLSALQHVDVVAGNSSSGLIEVPSFRIPTIDIGDRQRGRIKASSVISCDPDYSSIKEAFEKAYSTGFTASLREMKNPYGEKNASKEIVKVLKETDIENLLKKKFFDLK
ncbi:UDP-N-acetylglucosamine 2-epimerase (hydrolyzing) [Pontibacter diazotrophicus]|uniref:UDP-N-acetylglucosamine 2-epimerase (Hydrolyzing) n=1 Tax=Pontibacter diazotrophicus TaxID=1400979 RepID=A0A3D8LGT4_9BACT|nr:UDP-N-acetylglucosamine 2-epimerase [Pontibacter diazotrophicus]RDV16122.1 UDP-N-acetylglucosamine 2-epimerase (hydrolyzing) [Pontibacter diazotrophicus]